jgi:ATP adenylyltransferase
MEHLWTPWRSTYVAGDVRPPPGHCIFCDAVQRGDDESYILYRGASNFVLLNRYPYATGHLMIAPYEHVARMAQTSSASSAEMMELARAAERILEATYSPAGLNMGMNLGQAGGAGIAEHIHLHVLPRWIGDANFMTVVGNTRVMPESLEQTYLKLREPFGTLPRP